MEILGVLFFKDIVPIAIGPRVHRDNTHSFDLEADRTVKRSLIDFDSHGEYSKTINFSPFGFASDLATISSTAASTKYMFGSL